MNTINEKLVAEPERYEFSALPIHQFALARREFFKILGAGIAVFVVTKDTLAVVPRRRTANGNHLLAPHWGRWNSDRVYWQGRNGAKHSNLHFAKHCG